MSKPRRPNRLVSVLCTLLRLWEFYNEECVDIQNVLVHCLTCFGDGSYWHGIDCINWGLLVHVISLVSLVCC